MRFSRFLPLVVLTLLAMACSQADNEATPEPTAAPSDTVVADVPKDWTATAMLGSTGGLASNEVRAVFLGSSGRPPEPVAFWSSDGFSWERAGGSPGTMGAFGVFVDGGSNGFVSVITELGGNGGNTPVVSHSVDGSVWEAVGSSMLPSVRVGILDDVVAGPAGYVITGAEFATDPPAWFAWFSADGRSWVETDLPPIPGPLSIATDGSRWMAVGFEFEGASSPALVFISDDGLHWAPVATQTTPLAEQRPPWAPALLSGADNTWVLGHREGNGPPVLWVSNNGGENWAEHVVEPRSSTHGTYGLLSVEATGEGFVALGAYQRSDGHFQLVSSDGSAWTLSQDVPDLAALTAFDGRLVGADWDGNVYVREEQQTSE